MNTLQQILATKENIILFKFNKVYVHTNNIFSMMNNARVTIDDETGNVHISTDGCMMLKGSSIVYVKEVKYDDGSVELHIHLSKRLF